MATIKKFDEFVSETVIGGFECVDLGLPSGTLWAKHNIGSSFERPIGDYFAWGETEPKDEYEWSTYKFGKKKDLSKYTKIDNLKTLEPEDDAATMNMGDGWSMPTKNDFKELDKYTTKEYIHDIKELPEYKSAKYSQQRNIVGALILTSTINGAKMVIPFTGRVFEKIDEMFGNVHCNWLALATSTRQSNPDSHVIAECTGNFENIICSSSVRYYGFNVRGVYKK